MNERHSYFETCLKTRSEESGEKYIEGYFAVFGQETTLYDRCFESIDRNAFEDSLKNNDIRCLFNHDSGFVLGRTSNNTLELHTDSRGLWGRVKINQSDRQAADVYARVERGDISGCSFGFIPVSEDYEEKDDGIHWTVRKADTYEVSVCTFPAYPQTEITARERDHTKKITARKENLRKKLEALKNAQTT